MGCYLRRFLGMTPTAMQFAGVSQYSSRADCFRVSASTSHAVAAMQVLYKPNHHVRCRSPAPAKCILSKGLHNARAVWH